MGAPDCWAHKKLGHLQQTISTDGCCVDNIPAFLYKKHMVVASRKKCQSLFAFFRFEVS